MRRVPRRACFRPRTQAPRFCLGCNSSTSPEQVLATGSRYVRSSDGVAWTGTYATPVELVARNQPGSSNAPPRPVFPSSPSSGNSLSSGLGHPVFNDFQHPSGRPIPSNGGYPGVADMSLFSPSTRALQAHAPGQSLPQGLAAGYSRIHLQPAGGSSGLSPSSAAFSPSNIGISVNSPPLAEIDNSNGGLDWRGLTPTTRAVVGPPLIEKSSVPTTPTLPQAGPALSGGENGNTTTTGENGEGSGLSSMFSRLSYSAAAARGTTGAPNVIAPSSTAPPASASGVGMVPMSMSRKTRRRGALGLVALSRYLAP